MDFDDDDWLEAGLAAIERREIQTSALEELNKDHVAIYDGNRFRIVTCEFDEEAQRKIWKRIPKSDFLAMNSNTLIEKNGRLIPLGSAWVTWPRRKTARGGTCFDPKQQPGAIINGRLNTWMGWGVEPKKGNWTLLEKMIRDVLAAGNEQYAEYILHWLAWVIQNPAKRAEVALVFRGGKGLGKSTLGNLMTDIFGNHGVPLSNQNQLTGRFLGHISGACFVFADEAVWGGHHDSIGNLNKMITDPVIPIERKGVDLVTEINRCSLMIATNADWAVPASLDERRFAVFEPDERFQAQINAANAAFWSALHNQLADGGREAFFAAMLDWPLGDWHPRAHVPRTAALAMQALEGLKPIERWWFERCRDGEFPERAALEGTTESQWSDDWMPFDSNEVLADFESWRFHNVPAVARRTVSKKALIGVLQKFGWTRSWQGKQRVWLCPPLQAARDSWRQLMGGHDIFDESG